MNCRAAGDAAFEWTGLAEQVTQWNQQLDDLPQQMERSQTFLAALQKTVLQPQKCTIPALTGYAVPEEAKKIKLIEFEP